MAGLLVAEDVTAGHPDRLADLVVESLVEAVQFADPFAAVGLEVALHRELLLVTGYVAADRQSRNPLTAGDAGPAWLQRRVDDVVRSAGYQDQWSLPLTTHSDVVVVHRNDSITEGQGFSCDQDVVVGHAAPDAALGHLPLEVVAARAARDALASAQAARPDLFGPDGKVLVVLRPDGPGAVVEHLNIATVHRPGVGYGDLYGEVAPAVVDALRGLPGVDAPDSVDASWCTVNGAGEFLLPGPRGDGGLSGKKLVADLYGPRVPIGGGALCGKDAFKADRCGPLRARQVAVRLARATGTEATVWAGWFPGQARPSFLWARLGDGRELDESQVDQLVGLPDLSIKGTVAELELNGQPWTQHLRRGYVGADHPWDRG